MRYVKILGVALVAIAAMSSLGAASAVADEFTAEQYPVSLTGSKDASFVDEFTTTTGTVKCASTTYVGTVKAAGTEVRMAPGFGSCTVFGFVGTVQTNGCMYVFHLNGGASTEGDADLECPAGQEFTATAVAAGTTKCVIHIPSQADIGGAVKYSVIGSGATREITVDAALSGFDYTHTKGTGIGACTGGSSTTGTLTSKAVVTGETDGGSTHVGLFLS